MKRFTISLSIQAIVLIALAGCFNNSEPECYDGLCCDSGSAKLKYVTYVADAKAMLIADNDNSEVIASIRLEENTPNLPEYIYSYHICRNNLEKIRQAATYIYPLDTTISSQPYPYRISGKIFINPNAQPVCAICYPYYLHIDKVELITD